MTDNTGKQLTGVPGTSDYSYCKPAFEYSYPPISLAAGELLDRWEADRFKDHMMITLAPPPTTKGTDVLRHVSRVETMVSIYNGNPKKHRADLRAEGFCTTGPKGWGRAEAHLIFKGPVDILALKNAAREANLNWKVTGEYDARENWLEMTVNQKNCPPHDGCLHYVARHVDHRDAWPLYFGGGPSVTGGRKPARARKPRRTKQDNDWRRQALQDDADDAAWLAENRLPAHMKSFKTLLDFRATFNV